MGIAKVTTAFCLIKKSICVGLFLPSAKRYREKRKEYLVKCVPLP